MFDESKPRSVIRDFVARLITYAAVQTLPWICCVRERWGWWISLSGCTFGFWRWRMQHRNFDMENLGSLLLLRVHRSMARSLVLRCVSLYMYRLECMENGLSVRLCVCLELEYRNPFEQQHDEQPFRNVQPNKNNLVTTKCPRYPNLGTVFNST